MYSLSFTISGCAFQEWSQVSAKHNLTYSFLQWKLELYGDAVKNDTLAGAKNLNEAISVKNTQPRGNTSGNEINEKLRDEGRPQNIGTISYNEIPYLYERTWSVSSFNQLFD